MWMGEMGSMIPVSQYSPVGSPGNLIDIYVTHVHFKC